MCFSTIFTALFFPDITHEQTAQNLILSILRVAFFLLSAIAPKIKVRSRAIERFQRAMCPALLTRSAVCHYTDNLKANLCYRRIFGVWLLCPLADCPPDGWSSMDEPPYQLSTVSLCHCNDLSPACKCHPTDAPPVVRPLDHLAHACTLIHAVVASIWGVRLGWLGRMHPH